MLAGIRGDQVEQQLLGRAADLLRARQIDSDAGLGALLAGSASVEPAVLDRLQHLREAGAWVLVESAIADLPADLRRLSEAGAVTLDELALLHERIGITTIADLIDAVATHAVRAVPALGEPVEDAIRTALPGLQRSVRRSPLGLAAAIADPILEQIRSMPGVDWVETAGSLRRAEETVGHIEIVAAVEDPTPAVAAIAGGPTVDRVLHQSPRRLCLLTNRVQVGVRLPGVARAGSVLLSSTGSPAHFRALQARAADRGWQLTSDGLRMPDGALRTAAAEGEIYGALELPFIPAEIRTGEEEIAVAARGELPTLLSLQHMRGDLHLHSVWSDGRDSIEAMVTRCRGLGYEYAAITDHSPQSGAARTLTPQAVTRQFDEIAALRERIPEMAILHGCEVDILPDGRLDFPDRVLEQFDIVLASLHHRAGQSPDQLLRRYLDAMRHPLVTIVTHPTNRMIPNKPGYDLDYDRLFEAAVETGTCLEIDGAPGHLDLYGALARQAVAAGATLTVDSDAHRADVLARQMALGVAIARRGWVEPRHVLNTRPLADIRRVISSKRGT